MDQSLINRMPPSEYAFHVKEQHHGAEAQLEPDADHAAEE
jgi:hypothetical protein